MATIPFITDTAEFDERTNGETPVLVDFTASWCGPCKALAPVLDQLADDYDADTLQIVKVDVDDNPEIANRFGIQGVPQLYLIEEGDVLASFGGGSKPELKKRIDDLI